MSYFLMKNTPNDLFMFLLTPKKFSVTDFSFCSFILIINHLKKLNEIKDAFNYLTYCLFLIL
jgi:hypothetical protein